MARVLIKHLLSDIFYKQSNNGHRMTVNYPLTTKNLRNLRNVSTYVLTDVLTS